jgi:archaellum biogenesis ATPase FlaH
MMKDTINIINFLQSINQDNCLHNFHLNYKNYFNKSNKLYYHIKNNFINKKYNFTPVKNNHHHKKICTKISREKNLANNLNILINYNFYNFKNTKNKHQRFKM